MNRPAATSKSVAPQTRRAIDVLALAGGNVALAFGPWFVRLADVGPVAAGFWRLALAAPLLGALALGSGSRPGRLPRGLGLALLLGGLCFAADLGSWHLGILRTRLANATLFGNAATFLYPLYGFVIARAWPTRRQGLALGLAAAGAALLMGRSLEIGRGHLAGDLLCLAAGALYAGYFIFMARARVVLSPLAALTLSTLASLPPLLVLSALLGERTWPHHWGPLIGVALLSQLIGQGLMIYTLGRFPPLIVGLALLVQPVVAATVGWLAYGERLGPADLVGAALVAAALVLVRERGGHDIKSG